MIKPPTNLQEPWVLGQGCRQTVRMRGVCEPALQLRFTWEGLHLKNGMQSRGQNRTREIRPSGIVGGLWETWSMVELGSRRTIERVRDGNSRPTDERAQILSRQPHAAFEVAGLGNVSHGRNRIPLRNRKGEDRSLPTYGCARQASTLPGLSSTEHRHLTTT